MTKKIINKFILFVLCTQVLSMPLSYTMDNKGVGSYLGDYVGTAAANPEPLWMKGLKVGAHIGLYYGLPLAFNIAAHTTMLSYNTVVSQASAEWYHKWKTTIQTKLEKPSIDPAYYLSKPIKDIIKSIIHLDINQTTINSSNELYQRRKHYLLSGPPGLGKSSIVKQIAAQTNSYYLEYEATDFANLQVNEGIFFTKNIIDNIEKVAKKAKGENKKVIVLLDEVDGIGMRSGDSKSDTKSRNVISSLLTKLPKLSTNVTIIASTNFPFLLDTAFSRRFREIKMKLPNYNDRKKVLLQFARLYPMYSSAYEELENLTFLTNGFAYRDLSDLFNDADDQAKTEGCGGMQIRHLRENFIKLMPRIKKDLMRHANGYAELIKKKEGVYNSVSLEYCKEQQRRN